jgi:hypothetical protein
MSSTQLLLEQALDFYTNPQVSILEIFLVLSLEKNGI